MDGETEKINIYINFIFRKKLGYFSPLLFCEVYENGKICLTGIDFENL